MQFIPQWMGLSFTLVVLAVLGLRSTAPAATLMIGSGSRILQFDASTGNYLGDFTSGGSLSLAYDLTYGPDGNLYVCDFGARKILKFDGQTGAFLSTFATVSGFAPERILFGPDGNLYVGVQSGDVRRYNGATGVFMSTFAATPGSVDMGGFAFHNGSLFVTYVGPTPSLRQYDGTTGAFVAELYNGFTQGNGPRSPIFGADGSLYVPVWQSTNVAKFDKSTFAFQGNFISDGSLSPADLEIGPDGNLLALNDPGSSDTVRRYDIHTGAFLGTLVSAGSGSLGRGTSMILAIPEPTGALLFISGCILVGLRRRRAS